MQTRTKVIINFIACGALFTWAKFASLFRVTYLPPRRLLFQSGFTRARRHRTVESPPLGEAARDDRSRSLAGRTRNYPDDRLAGAGSRQADAAARSCV